MRTRSARRTALRLVVGIVAGLVARMPEAQARTEHKVERVALAIDACAAREVDWARLAERLELELSSIDTSVTVGSGDDEGSDWRVSIVCGSQPSSLTMTLVRRTPPAEHRGALPLTDLAPTEHARAVAMAVVEARALLVAPADQAADRPTSASPPAPAATPSAPSANAPPATEKRSPPPASLTLLMASLAGSGAPERNPRLHRFARALAIGLGVTTGALIVIGSPLLGVGLNGQPQQPGLVIPGATIDSLAALSALGCAAATVVAVQEQRKPLALSLVPLSGGAAVGVAGAF